jgi:hypothetical protein
VGGGKNEFPIMMDEIPLRIASGFSDENQSLLTSAAATI